MNLIGPKIKQVREAQNLTQEELAARCNIQGWDISRSILAKMESQVRRVTDKEAAMMANALGVDINELYSYVVTDT